MTPPDDVDASKPNENINQNARQSAGQSARQNARQNEHRNETAMNDHPHSPEQPFADDEILGRLTAADPVDPATLPSAGDPSARRLIDNLVSAEVHGSEVFGSNPSSAASATAEAGAVAGAPMLTNDRMTSDEISARRQARIDAVATGRERPAVSRRLPMLGAVAAVVLLVVGLTVFVPDSASPSVAQVQAAAASTFDVDSGRITTTFTANATDDVDEIAVSGVLEAAYVDEDLSITVDADLSDAASGMAGDLTADLTAEDLPFNEFLLVDDVAYVQMDDQWLAADTDGLLGSMVDDVVDPREVLTRVQELTEATEVGSTTVDGVDVTHFRSVVDPTDESLSSSGWLPAEALVIDADGEITVDMYVDGDGIMRQLDVSGDLQDPTTAEGPGEGTAQFTVSTRFYDLGADISIEAPADSIDMTEFVDGQFSGFEGLDG